MTPASTSDPRLNTPFLWWAAPVVGQWGYVFNTFDVPISSEEDGAKWVLTKSQNEHVKLQTRNIIRDLEKNKMPNIKGMGLNDVLYLLENFGLNISYSGRGSIKDQSINKGENIRKGQNLTIVLS